MSVENFIIIGVVFTVIILYHLARAKMYSKTNKSLKSICCADVEMLTNVEKLLSNNDIHFAIRSWAPSQSIVSQSGAIAKELSLNNENYIKAKSILTEIYEFKETEFAILLLKIKT